jgi:hypothetical protein
MLCFIGKVERNFILCGEAKTLFTNKSIKSMKIQEGMEVNIDFMVTE